MRVRHFWVDSAVALALLLGLTVALTGTSSARSADNSAFVRVVHAAGAAPNVDVYVDTTTTPVLTGFKFGTVTGYVPWPVGTHKVTITPAGQPLGSAVITSTVTAIAGANYTLAAVGDSKVAPGLFVFNDDDSITPGNGKARFYHLSTDAGPAALTMAFALGNKTVVPTIGFENASNYFTLKAGSYTFNVTLANGTTTVPQPLTLGANKVTSIFGVGQVSDHGVGAFRFVIATADAVPTAMPQTGFAPRAAPALSGSPLSGWLALAVALLVLLGGLQAYRLRAPAQRVRIARSGRRHTARAPGTP
jgi:hypothetical protein